MAFSWSIWDIDWSSRDRPSDVCQRAIPRGGSRSGLSGRTEAIRRGSCRRIRKSLRHVGRPRGEAIYYSHRVNQTVSLIRISARRGSRKQRPQPRPLTGLETDRAFALSATARRLVVRHGPRITPICGCLTRLATASTHRPTWKQLTNGSFADRETPHCRPMGQSIVFSIGHEPLANLHTMPVAGGSPKQLTFLDSFNVGGAWSADGKLRLPSPRPRAARLRVWTDRRGRWDATACFVR